MLFTRLPIRNDTAGLPVVNSNEISNISNFPLWRDLSAKQHWLPKSSGIVDPISRIVLNVGTTPVPPQGSNILTSPNNISKALRPGLLDAGAWTISCVFRFTGAVSGLGQILGNLTSSVGISIFVDSGAVYLTSRSGGYNSRSLGTIQVNTWYYAAISVNRVGQSATSVILGAAAVISNALAPAVGGDIGVGNPHYTAMSGNQDILEVAEIVVHDSYNSSPTLEALRDAARGRMLQYAGITVV